ncbi:SH3 domain-containing kinase-binding protein 1 [Neosynchiropus ocellatus]
MHHIYMHSNEHFEVFTTVLAPQGKFVLKYSDCRTSFVRQMVVVHSYKPQWPDEMELSAGDVILVLSKHEEGRWFGRLQDGQQGYFPASCVMELGQVNLPPRALRRCASLRGLDSDSGLRSKGAGGHIRQALKRGSKGGGGDLVLDGGPIPEQRHHHITVPQPVASQAHRSPGLLHRILSKCRRKSECQGTANGAFEGD